MIHEKKALDQTFPMIPNVRGGGDIPNMSKLHVAIKYKTTTVKKNYVQCGKRIMYQLHVCSISHSPGFLPEHFFRVRRAPKAQSPETNLAKKSVRSDFPASGCSFLRLQHADILSFFKVKLKSLIDLND
jgi:hypothetical protein